MLLRANNSEAKRRKEEVTLSRSSQVIEKAQVSQKELEWREKKFFTQQEKYTMINGENWHP